MTIEGKVRDREQPLLDLPVRRLAGARAEHSNPESLRTRAPLEQPAKPTPAPADRGRAGVARRRLLGLAIGSFLFIVAAAAAYLYWDNAAHFESTDDAFIV